LETRAFSGSSGRPHAGIFRRCGAVFVTMKDPATPLAEKWAARVFVALAAPESM